MKTITENGVEWPAVVPILTSKDIVRHVFSTPDGCRCLLGWRNKVFYGAAITIVTRALKHEIAQVDKQPCVFTDIIYFNDNKNNRLQTVAAVWNRAMRRLGYTVRTTR